MTNMGLRKLHGRDIASRIARIEHLAAAARELVDGDAPERAQDVLREIALHIEEETP